MCKLIEADKENAVYIKITTCMKKQNISFTKDAHQLWHRYTLTLYTQCRKGEKKLFLASSYFNFEFKQCKR